MNRLLTTTTALSVALSSIAPLPLVAQVRLNVDGQEVICLPNAERACPDGATCVVIPEAPCTRKAVREARGAGAAEDVTEGATEDAAAAEAAEAAAAEAAAAERRAKKAAAAEAAAAEAAAAEQAAAERRAKKAAAAEAAAAELAAAETAAAAAEQAAAEKAAADQAIAEQAAAEAAAAEKAAAEQAAQAVEATVVDEVETATEAETTTETTTAAQRQAARRAAAKAAAEEAAAAEAEAKRLADEAAAASDAAAAEAAEQARLDARRAARKAQAAAAAEEAAAAGVENPDLPVINTAEGVEQPPVEAVETLTEILTDETGSETGTVSGTETAPKPRKRKPAAATADDDAKPGATATVTEVEKDDTRTSDEDFKTDVVSEESETPVIKKRSGLSDLEKFGLVVLGGLVVGSLLKNGDKVVSNTGDRVVVEKGDGSYVVLKDDDTLLRQPGSTVSTETFNDGSTRTTVERDDGSRIVTIRDASGRVLRRAKVNPDGSQVLLLDDLAEVAPIDVTTLPKPQPGRFLVSTDSEDAALQAALLAVQAGEAGRAFSLRQIRDYPEVRALAPRMDVESITFETGSAAIRATEAEKLARLGRLMTDLIARNPAEMFLIEGHTDAVGAASYNLALSDRRAESLALALTEYFDVPPENLVVQGYGETELRIETDGNEPRNRRAEVLMISPLLQKLAQN